MAQWLALEAVGVDVGEVVGVDVAFLEVAFTEDVP